MRCCEGRGRRRVGEGDVYVEVEEDGRRGETGGTGRVIPRDTTRGLRKAEGWSWRTGVGGAEGGRKGRRDDELVRLGAGGPWHRPMYGTTREGE